MVRLRAPENRRTRPHGEDRHTGETPVRWAWRGPLGRLQGWAPACSVAPWNREAAGVEQISRCPAKLNKTQGTRDTCPLGGKVTQSQDQHGKQPGKNGAGPWSLHCRADAPCSPIPVLKPQLPVQLGLEKTCEKVLRLNEVLRWLQPHRAGALTRKGGDPRCSHLWRSVMATWAD
jgi:hypothetical protein